ncbi:hypothetical protein GCM10027168_54630 [Streptomyces capparidis]
MQAGAEAAVRAVQRHEDDAVDGAETQQVGQGVRQLGGAAERDRGDSVDLGDRRLRCHDPKVPQPRAPWGAENESVDNYPK